LIIPVRGFLGLEDYNDNSQKVILETPKECPQCKENLWKHGSFKRTAKDLKGNKGVISIQRLICSACSLTISCLFDFLAPFKQYVIEDILQYVVIYGQEKTTYRDIAWGEQDGSNTDAEASLSRAFCAVAQVCQISGELAQQAQQACLEAGVDLMTVEQSRCPNSELAHSVEKAKRLDQLSYLINLTNRYCRDVLSKCFWYRQKIFSGYLASEKLAWLSAPQSLKQALF